MVALIDIDSEIRDWVDNCLVPILVRQYLAERRAQPRRKNLLASEEELVRKSAQETIPPNEGER